MKLPPPPSSPPGSGDDKPKPTYVKDKTLTRRTVKGAAGGMLGVDYEDPRRPNASSKPREGPDATPRRSAKEAGQQRVDARGAAGREAEAAGEGKDESYVIREDEDAETRGKKSRRHHVARDRLSIDKDAPELVRTRRRDVDEDDDASDETEQIIDLFDEDSGDDSTLAPASRAHLFEKVRSREPGDLTLVHPEQIKQALRAPTSYAKHVMILAEVFRRKTGADRDEAIAYMAQMFISLSDRSFGRVSLKEFGPSTGIIDIYPLEIVEHIVEKHPGFLPKVGFGTLFSPAPEQNSRALFLDAGRPHRLEYPKELKIRSFAIRDGLRPGYSLEPADEEGAYVLVIDTPGQFELLFSGTNRTGYTFIDRRATIVRGERVAEAQSPQQGQGSYPPRNERAIRAWPTPKSPEPIDPREMVGSAKSDRSPEDKLLSAAELAWRRASGAMGEGPLSPGPYVIDDD